MPDSRFVTLALGLIFLSNSALAQSSIQVHWPMLVDPAAQQFEDPYRDLTPSQFESLMRLARAQIALDEADLGKEERAANEEQAAALTKEMRAQGLDPDWILAQREFVAERRRQAALSTNPELDGKQVEIEGYLLVAPDVDDGGMVAHLFPDRGVCMHLPPPAPNQLVRLKIEQFPEPLGACIATAVRGRLSPIESTATVPVLDDTVPLWSRWHLDVSEVSTSGSLPLNDNQS